MYTIGEKCGQISVLGLADERLVEFFLKVSTTCFLLFATVQEGAAEAGQGREEELVARVRYIREVEATNQRG